ncbi:four-helix bundle copper-binding protein (plasmid) [Cytobacillus spongiae]|nr:four-helix bundle copper-binding protein [Cytobacillus spongiae]MCA1063013.1 four-helix bundle copper-binding protein [Rossellomorea aquimaris]UII58613.1 four-helix bundle copper-binding protein [Cytobacillus spongiae]WJV28365.1 four-helix bundle copper-binding protein [Rossellomorea sp. AcN35-11]
MNAAYKPCIAALQKCVEACNICYHASLKGEREMMPCIELDRECADICTYTINLMQRSSKFVHSFLAICAEICDECGTECRSHGQEHCQDCAKACFDCAEECRKLLA